MIPSGTTPSGMTLSGDLGAAGGAGAGTILSGMIPGMARGDRIIPDGILMVPGHGTLTDLSIPVITCP